MAVSEETQSILRAAKVIRRLADEVVDRAYELVAAGGMAPQDLVDLKNTYYWPMRQVAGDLVLKQARIESEKIAPHVAQLNEATKRLEEATETVAQIGEVVTIAVTALSIITSLVGVVLSPDSESLGDVAERIGGLAKTIGEVAAGSG